MLGWGLLGKHVSLKKSVAVAEIRFDSQPTARTCPIGSTWCQVPCLWSPCFFVSFLGKKNTIFLWGEVQHFTPRNHPFFSPIVFCWERSFLPHIIQGIQGFQQKNTKKSATAKPTPRYRAENSGQLWCFRWQVFKCHETSGFHRRPLKIRSRMVGVLLVLGLLWLYYWITMGLLKVGKLRTIDYIGLQWISCISSIHCRLVDRKARQLWARPAFLMLTLLLSAHQSEGCVEWRETWISTWQPKHGVALRVEGHAMGSQRSTKCDNNKMGIKMGT